MELICSEDCRWAPVKVIHKIINICYMVLFKPTDRYQEKSSHTDVKLLETFDYYNISYTGAIALYIFVCVYTFKLYTMLNTCLNLLFLNSSKCMSPDSLV